MTAVTSAIADLERQLEMVIEQQRRASARHDKALQGLQEALDHLAEVFDLSDPEGDVSG